LRFLHGAHPEFQYTCLQPPIHSQQNHGSSSVPRDDRRTISLNAGIHFSVVYSTHLLFSSLYSSKSTSEDNGRKYGHMVRIDSNLNYLNIHFPAGLADYALGDHCHIPVSIFPLYFGAKTMWSLSNDTVCLSCRSTLVLTCPPIAITPTAMHITIW
jgi:hypothetical protein